MNNEPRFNTRRIQKAFGASAPYYDQHAELQQEIRDDCLELAKHYWQKGAHILDIGTGTGALAQSVKEEELGWHVYGLDMSFNMCAQARTHGTGIVNANAESIPFAEASFDGIFSSLMLQWANDPLQVFKEIFRIIKPGGYCILSTFTHGTLDELRESFATLDSAIHVNDFGPPNYFSALAVHAGFQLLSCDEETITEYYPDVVTLMRCLKSIGASTKQQGKQKPGLMTPRQLKQLDKTYRHHFIHEDGLPATWQVMTLLLERP